MNGPPVDISLGLRVREHVVVQVNSVTARFVGALALFSAACWLIVILARHHDQPDWHYAARLGWSLTVLTAVALIARGYKSLMNITPCPINTLSSIVTPSQIKVWLEILHLVPILALF